MRELILSAIENIRITESGFDPATMRWQSWYFIQAEGFGLFYSKKERNRHKT